MAAVAHVFTADHAPSAATAALAIASFAITGFVGGGVGDSAPEPEFEAKTVRAKATAKPSGFISVGRLTPIRQSNQSNADEKFPVRGESPGMGAGASASKMSFIPHAGSCKFGGMKQFLSAALMFSGSLFAGDVKIEDPWIRAMPPSSPATAAFMVISNRSDKVVAVTGGTCPVAGEVRPMITTLSKVGGREVAGMEFVSSFSVPPGKKRVLEPGGDHIMLMKLKDVPKAGTTVPMVIWIESGGHREKISLEVPVR